MIELIYHYTSAEVLSKILISKKLRFTEMRSLNDTSEYLYGLQLLKDKITQYEIANHIETLFDLSQFDKLFHTNELCSISFTKKRDDLSFWNSYYVPKKGAVAIGFNRDALADKRTYIANDCVYGDLYPSLTKADYEWFKMLLDIRYLAQQEDMRYKLHHLTFQTAHIKHKAFKLEDEVRAVSFLTRRPEPLNEFERDGKIIKCIDLPFNINSINEIIIGPSVVSQDTYKLVKELLNEYGVKCNVFVSNIPLNL